MPAPGHPARDGEWKTSGKANVFHNLTAAGRGDAAGGAADGPALTPDREWDAGETWMEGGGRKYVYIENHENRFADSEKEGAM